MKVLLLYFLGAIFFSSSPPPSDWMDRAIAKEFARYEKTGISKTLLETSWDACKKHKEFHRYQVIDSKVYGPESRIKILLEEIIKRYPLPDVDFIYYYEDRLKPTFFKRPQHRKSAPLFVSAKHHKIDQAVLFADWNYDIRDETSGWNFQIRTVQENQCEWALKKEQLFWRGTPWDGKHFGMYTFDNWTTLPRGRLVLYGRQLPELIDAAFSQYPDACAEQDLSRCIAEMGPIRFISWKDVLQYKYQMIVDGVTCTFPATQWKLLSGSVSFKQDSPDIQYYYGELVPWKHYIPVKRDLSDLPEKLEWAKTHDGEAEAIAQNAREFAQTHLMPEHILLYCYKTLCKYASLQKFKPSVP